jgi:hypothetical protein
MLVWAWGLGVKQRSRAYRGTAWMCCSRLGLALTGWEGSGAGPPRHVLGITTVPSTSLAGSQRAGADLPCFPIQPPHLRSPSSVGSLGSSHPSTYPPVTKNLSLRLDMSVCVRLRREYSHVAGLYLKEKEWQGSSDEPSPSPTLTRTLIAPARKLRGRAKCAVASYCCAPPFAC